MSRTFNLRESSGAEPFGYYQKPLLCIYFRARTRTKDIRVKILAGGDRCKERYLSENLGGWRPLQGKIFERKSWRVATAARKDI
jgi:hypothetical protein